MSDAVKDAPTGSRQNVLSLRVETCGTQDEVVARSLNELTIRTVSKIEAAEFHVRLASVDTYAKAIDRSTAEVVAAMENQRRREKSAKAWSLHKKGARR